MKLYSIQNTVYEVPQPVHDTGRALPYSLSVESELVERFPPNLIIITSYPVH